LDAVLDSAARDPDSTGNSFFIVIPEIEKIVSQKNAVAFCTAEINVEGSFKTEGKIPKLYSEFNKIIENAASGT
jgi:hypothetical protein